MKWKSSSGRPYSYSGGALFTGLVVIVLGCLVQNSAANPDAKRLYDDLLSTYNRLIRPVSNNNDTVLVKLGLRLSQLIELVSTKQSKGSWNVIAGGWPFILGLI